MRGNGRTSDWRAKKHLMAFPIGLCWKNVPRRVFGLLIPAHQPGGKKIVLVQFAGILAVVDDTVVRLFAGAGPAPESSPDTKFSVVNSTVINQSASEAFQSSTYQSSVRIEVQKSPTEPHVAIDMTTCTTGCPVFTVLVVEYVKNEVAERFLEKTKMDYYTSNKQA